MTFPFPSFCPYVPPPLPIARTFIRDGQATDIDSSVSFGNFTISEAGVLVAFIHTRGNRQRTVSSVTFGGSSGTIHSSGYYGAAASENHYAIASRVMSAGTHNITINMSGDLSTTTSAQVISAWLITNYNSATPTFASTDTTGSTLSLTASFTGPGVGCGMVSSIAEGTPSYSNLTQQTSETTPNGTYKTYAFSVYRDEATTVNRTVSASGGWGTTNGILTFACWN